jgi:hypothetical protein
VGLVNKLKSDKILQTLVDKVFPEFAAMKACPPTKLDAANITFIWAGASNRSTLTLPFSTTVAELLSHIPADSAGASGVPKYQLFCREVELVDREASLKKIFLQTWCKFNECMVINYTSS